MTRRTPTSVPPPSSLPPSIPPGEEHAFAVAEDGTRLFWRRRQGEHAPGAIHAFLCDGILCDGFVWKYLWDDLAPEMPITHWHYRGHGRSAAPRDPDFVDIRAHASDLDRVRSAVGRPPAVLFGHSMGCQVALEAFRSHGEGIRGAVLLCGSFGRVTSTFKGMPVLDLVLPKLLKVAETRPSIVRALWSRIPPEMTLKLAMRAGELDPEKTNPDDILPYIRHMTHVDFSMFLRMLRAAGEHSAGDLLASIAVPVLVVAGERDTFTPPFLAEGIAEAIPGAELLMVPGGTHAAPIEQHELVNSTILDFLERRVLT